LRRSGGGGAGREKLIAFDFGGYANATVGAGVDPYDLAAAADIDLAGLGDEFREREDEFDLGADFELIFGEKIEALITDIASLRAKFVAVRCARKDP